MTATKIALVAGVALLGFLCFLAAAGMTVITEGLVTLVVLVVLIAGGNLLSGRAAYGARASATSSVPGGAAAAGEPVPGSQARSDEPAADRPGAVANEAEEASQGATDPPEHGET